MQGYRPPMEVAVGRPGVLFINFGGPQGPEELEPFVVELTVLEVFARPPQFLK